MNTPQRVGPQGATGVRAGRKSAGPLLRALAWLSLCLLAERATPAESASAGGSKVPERFYETATVEAREVGSATAAVTVIDRDALESFADRSIVDVLRSVPGVTVVTDGSRGGLSTARIRGGDPNFTLVLLDGVPLNDPTYQVGGVFNLEGLSLASVERIEVVRGPLSAHYGSTGLAGAINIITRRSGSGPAASRLTVGAGDAERRVLRVGGGGGGEVVALHFGAALEEEAHRIAGERFESATIQFRLDGLESEGVDWEVSGRAVSWQALDYPDASGGPVLGSGELRESDHQELVLGARVRFDGSGAVDHRLTFGGYRHEMARESPAVAPLVPASSEATVFTRSRFGYTSVQTPFAKARLALGVDLEVEQARSSSSLLLPAALGGRLRGDYSRDRLLPGAFANLQVERGPATWEVSARLDVPEGGEVELNPRVGVSRLLANERTRLRASLGRAFKQPSFFAQSSPRALGGNPDLVAETAVGVDLGFEHRFPGGIEAGLGAFGQRFRNLVDFDFASFLHVNRSRVEARGLEGWLAWAGRGAWSADVSLTWQEVENLDDGSELRHRPSWSGVGRVGWRVSEFFSIDLDIGSLSSFRDEQIPVPSRNRVAGRSLLGAAVRWRFSGGWSGRLRLDNLANRDYESLIGYPGAGRAAFLSLDWQPGD